MDTDESAPPAVESRVERLIREAVARGEFDRLSGAGEPLAILEEPYEDAWWVKRWIEREAITADELRQALEQRRRR